MTRRPALRKGPGGIGGMLRFVLVCALAATTLAGCRGHALAPVDPLPEDICTHCKMAISDKRYAAEYLTRDGDAVKFDDIGCMASYLRDHHPTNIAAYYVVDYATRRWLKAQDAMYVRSSALETPMSSGIVAFRDAPAAQEAAATYHGKVLQFTQLGRS